jgi:hypothetical protein
MGVGDVLEPATTPGGAAGSSRIELESKREKERCDRIQQDVSRREYTTLYLKELQRGANDARYNIIDKFVRREIQIAIETEKPATGTLEEFAPQHVILLGDQRQQIAESIGSKNPTFLRCVAYALVLTLHFSFCQMVPVLPVF